ncbi:MAG TPA: hypothetical protein VIH76_05560 [Candidatus Acidoferrales bacterium]
MRTMHSMLGVLRTAGRSRKFMEVYGDWNNDSALLETTIKYLLA